jgi:hypothetical protein
VGDRWAGESLDEWIGGGGVGGGGGVDRWDRFWLEVELLKQADSFG